MALWQRGFSVLRQGVLSNIRLAPSVTLPKGLAGSPALAARGFADASYLDKSAVTERVLNIVKNFEKVDASKVCPLMRDWLSRLAAMRGQTSRSGRELETCTVMNGCGWGDGVYGWGGMGGWAGAPWVVLCIEAVSTEHGWEGWDVKGCRCECSGVLECCVLQ